MIDSEDLAVFLGEVHGTLFGRGRILVDNTSPLFCYRLVADAIGARLCALHQAHVTRAVRLYKAPTVATRCLACMVRWVRS